MSIGELPHLAWVDFDTLDFAIRSAHTYNLCIKCNAFQFVDDNSAVAVVGEKHFPVPSLLYQV